MSWWDSLKGMFDYSGVGEAMPEHIGRERLLDPAASGAVSLATLPKRAFGASETMRTEGPYNPEPIVEAATLPLGTGGIAGVSAVPGEAIFGSGILRRKPLIGGYHGTGSPSEFTKFELPPATHDLGIHSTIDPNVSAQYARNKASFGTTLSHLAPEGEAQAYARNIPVLIDTKSPLKVPFDAGKWNRPENVIEPLQEAIAKGPGYYQAPRGLLSDLENISGSEATWQSQFKPMLKEKGYDSIFYPHFTDYSVGGGKKFNTFMTFDPEQTIPRFTPEGRKLEWERGVREPMKMDPAYGGDIPKWRIPQGILKKIEDPEPFGPIKERVAANTPESGAPSFHSWMSKQPKFKGPLEGITEHSKKMAQKYKEEYGVDPW